MRRLRYLTAGESHGRGLVGILEGMPAGLVVQPEIINRQLARRQRGHGRGGRMRIEQDQAEVIAGIRFGKTLGSPIALLVWNRDWQNWQRAMDPWQEPPDYQPVTVPRPGHADLAGALKYGFSDIRNVLERASARETTMRVALGALPRHMLAHFGIQIASHVIQLHEIRSQANARDFSNLSELLSRADGSPVRCLDPQAEREMIARIDQAKAEKNTVGGVFELLVSGLPVGLGSHVHWDRKLDARIAAAMLSLQAMKGVGIGSGFEAASRWGSEAHDAIYYDEQRGFYRREGRSGGIEGGMSTGELLSVRVAMKPLSTLMQPLDSVDIISKRPVKAHVERSDVCAVPAASIIGENLLAFTLADALLEKYGGDSIAEIEGRFGDK